MKTNIIVNIGFICFFILLISSISVSGYEDEKVSVYGYFSWQNEDGSWHDWMNVTNLADTVKMNLKIEQPVKCKIIIIPHENAAVGFSIREPGPADSRTFDVIEGGQHDEAIDYGLVESETKIEYNWTLQTNNRWAGGTAPLNAYWQINLKGPIEKSGYIGFTEAYIENAQWNGPTTPSNNNKNTTGDPTNHIKSTPGFEFLFMIIALSVALFVCQSWIWKRKQ